MQRMTSEAYKRHIRVSTRVAFYVVWFATGSMMLCALFDQLFQLGWGYRLVDIAGLFGIFAFSIVVYLAIRFIFRIVNFGEF